MEVEDIRTVGKRDKAHGWRTLM